MNNKKTNFANGFDYFCINCGHFFSAQAMESFSDNDLILESDSALFDDLISFCPCCGEDMITNSVEDLLSHCAANNCDPVNFYSAFPIDEPIRGSRTGATPRDVLIIIDLVAMRKEKRLPVTAEGIAGKSHSLVETVRKVFEELHITETGGAQ